MSTEDDCKYVRGKMLIPVLDHEERDVIIVMHSYSAVPGSAAAKGLGKAERKSQSKRTGVTGHVYLSALLTKGGDGKDVPGTFGGHDPPHIRADPSANLLRCDDRIPPLYQDVPGNLIKTVAVATMVQGMTSTPPSLAPHGIARSIRDV